MFKKVCVIFLAFLIIFTSNSIYAEEIDGASAEKIIISLAGDVSFSTYVKSQVDKHGVSYPLANVRDIFENDDITFINLETAITNIPKPSNPNKEYNFASYPNTAQELRDSSIDIVSLGNNHTLDYGLQGFIDTMNYLDEAEVQYVGGGRNYKEALKYEIYESKGRSVAVIAFNRVVPSKSWLASDKKPGHVSLYDHEIDKILAYISDIKSKVDYLVMAIHWQGMPTEEVKANYIKAGHKLIDAGVDVLMGSHPHVMQGAEYYKNGIIFYSLGNFVFPTTNDIRQNRAAIVQLEINSNDLSTTVKYIPTKTANSRPVILQDKERINEINYINKLNKKFNSYIQANGYMIKR